MKLTGLCLFIIYMCTAQCHKFNDGLIKEYFQYENECLAERKVPEEVLEAAYFKKDYSNPQYKEFLECLFKEKYKYVNEDGTYRKDKIFEHIEKEFGKDIAENYQKGCFEGENENKKGDFIHLEKCYLAYTPQEHNYTEASKKEYYEAQDSCVKDLGTTKDIIRKSPYLKDYKAEEYKKYLTCMYKELGVIDTNGHPNRSAMLDYVKKEFKPETAKIFEEKCLGEEQLENFDVLKAEDCYMEFAHYSP